MQSFKTRVESFLLNNEDICKSIFYCAYIGVGEDWEREIDGLKKMKIVSFGDDYGIERSMVCNFQNDDEELFIKFYGNRHSFIEDEYVGFKFVEPKEKVVISYE